MTAGKLLRAIVPAGVTAFLVGGMAAATAGGWLPDAVAFWLWPSLFAVLLLGLAALLLARGSRVWVWPPAVGFVAQATGILLLVARVLESRWEPTWYTLGAIAVTLAAMGVVWSTRTIRARSIERQMSEGLGDGDGPDLERIRGDMQQALSLLRRAGRGRNAIYELPWFLVMGRPAAGKTVAIKNSGLGLPVKKDWVKGVGGTYTCDWFFTNELIFLDTPGRWVTEGADEGGQAHWKQLLRLLRRNRGRRPLDGLIVVVPADDLLGLDEAALDEQAANARAVVDLIHAELHFRFPVYLLVTKCDLVDGFVDFFRSLPAQRRHEILGWSNDDPTRDDAADLVRSGFRRVRRRLESYRLEMLGRIARRSHARRLLFFTEEFAGLERPLAAFADTFFRQDRFSEAPVFRGFYLSSGTQGEGEPMARAIGRLARNLGVRPTRAAAAQADEPKRAYFLLDLFRELMVHDEGLVGRTAGHWWRRRRNTLVGAFAPAGLAVGLLLLSSVAFMLNRGLYGQVARQAPEIVAALDAQGGAVEGPAIVAALQSTGRLRGFHRKMAGFSPFRGWGMRRPGELDPEMFALYRDEFVRAVLQPTLAAAERLATSPDESCTAKVDVLHSVVWLRMGRRAQFDDDLSGFDRVWNLPPEQAAEARRELLRQYGYFLNDAPRGVDRGPLLPGFSIREVARHVHDACGSSGAASTLAMYQSFQESCRDAVTRSEVEDCWGRLNEVLRHRQDDYRRFVDHFRALTADLDRLQVDEPEAKKGLELLAQVDLAESEASECLTRFEGTVVPVVSNYAVRDDFLDECRQAVETISDRGEKFRVRNEILRTQEQSLDEDARDLEQLMRDYSLQCRGEVDSFRRLDFDVLRKVATSYRRVSCLDSGEPETPAPAAPRPADVASAPPLRSSWDWFEPPRAVADRFRVAHWRAREAEWKARLDNAEAGYDDSQRRHLVDEVRGEIAADLDGYVAAWRGYLAGLSLKPRRGSAADWLRKLSTTAELASILRPAAEATRIADPAAAAPFDVVAERMRPLDALGRFVAEQLPRYQGMLGQLAADLDACTRDPEFFRSYRAAVAAGRPDNTLVRARAWIRTEAGAGLAGGALQDVLARPLDAAESFVHSDNLLKGQWADLRSLWREGLAGHAPFAGADAGEPVDLPSLIAMFGGESGAVRRVRQVAGDGKLAPAAASWLTRAEQLSRIFFEPDSDRLRPARVRLTVGEPVLAPDGFAHDTRVDRIRVYLGEGSDFVWSEDGDDSRPLSIPLFGDAAGRYAYVRGTLSHKKGLFGRVIGSDWKDGEALEAVAVEGFWAPLRVLGAGLSGGGGGPEGQEVALSYTIEAPFKRDRPAEVDVPIRASGGDLPVLLRLLREGLPDPPDQVTGG